MDQPATAPSDPPAQRATKRRAGPVLALVALGWVLRKLLSRSKA